MNEYNKILFKVIRLSVILTNKNLLNRIVIKTMNKLTKKSTIFAKNCFLFADWKD